MFKTLFTVVVLLTSVLSPLKAQHSINTEKSQVTFKIKNMKFKTVEGSFTNMTGTVDYNNGQLSLIDACISANTVNTESKKRDKHLKNEDFFDVSTFPDICFEASDIKKQDDKFIANGKLTLHGVTKDVQIPITIENNTLNGTLHINRLDYKLGESTGTFMVGNEVDLTIICTF